MGKSGWENFAEGIKNPQPKSDSGYTGFGSNFSNNNNTTSVPSFQGTNPTGPVAPKPTTFQGMDTSGMSSFLQPQKPAPGYMQAGTHQNGYSNNGQYKSGGQKTTAPYGMDQTQPGVAEQYWDQNQDMFTQAPQLDWINSQLGQFENPMFGEQYGMNNINSFASPGQGQQYWNQVQGNFNQQGQYNGPNLAAESYGRTVANIPGSLTPQFDQAYDRALEKGVGTANAQAAARGQYGSSAALNNVGNVIADVEAARANRASDFALQDSQNQANWMGLAGQQGRSADLSEMGGFGTNLSGLNTFGDLAFRAEGQDLSRDQFGYGVASGIQGQGLDRLGAGFDAGFASDNSQLNHANAGMNASMGAQGMRDGRMNDSFNNQMNYMNQLLGFFSGQYGDMFGSDMDLMMGGQQAGAAGTQNQVNDDRYQRNRIWQDAQGAVDLATGIKGLG
jgi:hypothetical protein